MKSLVESILSSNSAGLNWGQHRAKKVIEVLKRYFNDDFEYVFMGDLASPKLIIGNNPNNKVKIPNSLKETFDVIKKIEETKKELFKQKLIDEFYEVYLRACSFQATIEKQSYFIITVYNKQGKISENTKNDNVNFISITLCDYDLGEAAKKAFGK